MKIIVVKILKTYIVASDSTAFKKCLSFLSFTETCRNLYQICCRLKYLLFECFVLRKIWSSNLCISCNSAPSFTLHFSNSILVEYWRMSIFDILRKKKMFYSILFVYYIYDYFDMVYGQRSKVEILDLWPFSNQSTELLSFKKSPC